MSANNKWWVAFIIIILAGAINVNLSHLGNWKYLGSVIFALLVVVGLNIVWEAHDD